MESNSSAGSAGHVVPARLAVAPGWPVAVAAGVYLVLLLVGGRLLNDPDTFWQIALGRWILAHQSLPHTDFFSYTMAGKDWISSEWLSQVLYALADKVAGWHGVVILTAAAIAGAFGLLTHILLRRLAVLPAMVFVAAAFGLLSGHMTARPHVLVLPVMVIWVAGLVSALDEKRRPSFFLLPVMTLWANLHGGFTFGLFLLAPAMLEAVWTAAPAQRVHVARQWAAFVVPAVLAACLTPYGPRSILVTAHILGLGPALQLIGEWKPQDFSTLTPFALCLLAGIGIALYRGLTLPPFRLLTILGLLYMALSHNRSGDLLGLLAPLYIAAPLALQIGKASAPEPAHRIGMQSILLFVFAFGFGTAGATAMDYRPGPQIAPARALAAAKETGRRRILNGYEFGGYLIASGVKPFVDGRTELYGAQFMLRYHRAVSLADVAGFLRLLHDYDVDVTLLPQGMPAIGLLDRLPGWKRVYADDIAVVHVRTMAATSAGGVRQ